MVSANYRLGALGFLDARPLGGIANAGVRDALCALAWVRDHIAAFGGDPARIVAFGESAGGGLLLHALASGQLRGVLAGAIVQSGATFTTFDTERATLVRETLTKEAGLADGADLRTLPVDALIAAQSAAMTTLMPTVGMMPYHPMVDDDLIHAAGARSDRGRRRGRHSVGLRHDRRRDGVVRGQRAHTAARQARTSRRALICASTSPARARSSITTARALATDDLAVVWRAFFGDFEMQAPARAIVAAQAAHAPAYTYLFTWEGPDVGACHGIDIPFPFDNFGDGWDAFVGLDDDGRALGHRMRDAWAAFACASEPGWSAYPEAMVFGRDSHVAPVHPLFARLPAVEL